MYLCQLQLSKETARNSSIDFDIPFPSLSAPLYYSTLIIESEVYLMIKQTSKNTSLGFERIPNYIMVQKPHPNSIFHLNILLNRIFDSATIPSAWKLYSNSCPSPQTSKNTTVTSPFHPRKR